MEQGLTEKERNRSGRRGKGQKIGKIIGIILLCIVAVAAVLLIIYHHAAYMVVNNWRNPTDQVVEEGTWDNGEAYRNIPYAEVSSSDYLDLYVPSDTENPPLLVIIHGGGFITGDTRTAQAQKMYLYFRDHGYACASVQYRLAQEAPFPACVQDVKAAIRFLRANADAYGYDADHIAVFGESAGGYLATMAAFTNDDEFNDLPYIGEEASGEGGIPESSPESSSQTTRDKDRSSGTTETVGTADGEGGSRQVSSAVQVLIDYYGAVDLGDKEPDWEAEGVPKLVRSIANSWLSGDVLEGYANPESFLLRQDVSTMSSEEMAAVVPATYVAENMGKAVNPAVWIAHGDSDITVPIEQSDRLYNQLSELTDSSRLHYEIIAGAGHASRLMYTDEELARIETFMHPFMK